MSDMFREPGRGEDILTAFRRLMNFVRRERVVAGDGIIIKQSATGKTLSVVKRGAFIFSGTAYIAGHKTTGLGTKAWVRCHLDTATAEDHDGPPPDPFPMNEEWYEVAQTHGNINIHRA